MNLHVPYDLSEHRHRFAVWAAARAVQRGFRGGKTGKLRRALETTDIKNAIAKSEFSRLHPAKFDRLHRDWCNSIISDWNQRKEDNPEITYGRAAKLIAIYLKATVILGGGADTPVARTIHPPIDNILLKNLATTPVVRSPHKTDWGKTSWTKLGESEYYALIEQLRAALPCDWPFWMFEKYWNVTE
jgi:hypothetical protein